MLLWYYSAAIGELVGIWRNFLWFTYNFFSIGLLARTLFSPWRSLGEPYRGGLDPWGWAETFVVNFLMRIVGVIIRLIFILLGAAVLLTETILGAIALIGWLVLPAVIIAISVAGGRLLF